MFIIPMAIFKLSLVLGKTEKLESSTLWRRPPTSRIRGLEKKSYVVRNVKHAQGISISPLSWSDNPVMVKLTSKG